MTELSIYELFVLSAGAVIAGIWLLVRGGDLTIDASVAIARRAQLSRVFIGATIIAFGTSVPELFTSVNANLSGFPGISLGNVIGSNIANILLVMGAAALIVTLTIEPGKVMRDLLLMLVATAVFIAGTLYGVFERCMGIAMFVGLVGFVVWQYLNNEIDTSEVEDVDMPGAQAALYLVGGIAGLAIGSELLVRGAVVVGGVIGVPEAIIGMTAVAIGTSLPELTASITAARKGETELMFGNIIGSNTFNILSIVGITAIIKPLQVDPVLAGFELWFMVAVSVGFAAMLFMKVAITRQVGFAFLVAYLLFTLFQFRDTIV